MKLKEIIISLRPQQWYKNLVIFIPIIFAGKLNETALITKVIIGFILLCLISSVGYILNDILDIEQDKIHPEKKKRPLASEKISIKTAIFLAIITFSISIFISLKIGAFFTLYLLLLLLSSLLYSIYTKHIFLVDVIHISINFVIRVVAGGVIAQVFISPWLIMISFLLALVLALGKRVGELRILNEKAISHRNVLKSYTPEFGISLTDISAAMLLFSYTLYTIQAFPYGGNTIFLTIPIATFLVFRYLYFIHSGDPLITSPDKVFKDQQMVIAMCLWLFISIISIYGI